LCRRRVAKRSGTIPSCPTPDDLLERAFLSVVRRVSGRTVAIVALLLYPCAGLLVPLALHWSLANLVVANVLGTLFAGVVSLGWLLVQVEARDRLVADGTLKAFKVVGDRRHYVDLDAIERLRKPRPVRRRKRPG
jgi:hypothetical protein